MDKNINKKLLKYKVNNQKKLIKRRHTLKTKIKKILIKIIYLLLVSLFAFSLYHIVMWFIDNNNINKELQNVNKNVQIKTIKDNNNTKIIENKNSDDDPYWSFIKTDLIDVDFAKLKKINKDTKGWIQVPNTNINYPFVQSTDNSFYLNHSFNRKYNGGGWVFLDYRNKLNQDEKNTIIYAHGRENKTMFGTLKNILKTDWVNNKNNHYIKLSTEYENTLWQVFSIYKIPTTNDYLQIEFKKNEFLKFANKLLKRSQHNFQTNINEKDRILTLSTCYNNYEKVVLHAKLIKYEKK